MAAFIKNLYMQQGVMREHGVLQSEHFQEGVRGFRLKANGDAEFNEAIVRGELQARFIRITGSVSSGTAFILRSNNDLSIIDGVNASWIPATLDDVVVKEIKTLAMGSCTIRLRFPIIESSTMANRNRGRFKITVNDDVVTDWTPYEGRNTNIDIPNVSLPNQVNFIKLYGGVLSMGNMGTTGFYNTIFELRCAQDPGFLAVLG